MPVKKSLVIKIIVLAAFFVIMVIAQFFWDISSYFNPGNIKQLLYSAGSFAPLLFMLVMAAAVVISPIPSLPLDVAAGAVFGPFLGTLYAALGALAGSIISFMIPWLIERYNLFWMRSMFSHVSPPNPPGDDDPLNSVP